MKRLKLSTNGRKYGKEEQKEFVIYTGLNTSIFNDVYGLEYTITSGYSIDFMEPYRMFNIVDESKFTMFALKYSHLIISIEESI